MIYRQIEPTLRRLAAGFPVLALTGPRQSGKTTLARALFADRPYVSLEDPAERAFAQEDPRGFLARFAAGAVFDEAQRWPDLFSWLQGMVDEVRVPGRFVLTGSQQFGLLAHITQSLAGRVGVAHLLALSVTELSAPPYRPWTSTACCSPAATPPFTPTASRPATGSPPMSRLTWSAMCGSS